ncbi:MAG: hypothetical protein WA152_01100 [Microgenomates group bacterium]
MPDIQTINLLQRITGISAFVLITLQIFLSSNRKFLKFHMLNGILAYTFVFIHPILMILYRYSYSSDFDPFYVYTDVCVLCDGIYEHYINLGRIAFYLLTISVFVAKFRKGISILGKTTSDWIVNNWRKLHVINYLVFYIISIHAYNIGSDSTKQWFIYLFWFCQIVVLGVLLKKLREKLMPVQNV